MNNFNIYNKMKNKVFNNSIGASNLFNDPILTQQEEKLILAALFEQLLIFDKITISTNRSNFALKFLLKNLGVSTLERLLDSGYIEFMIWSPIIAINVGHQSDDGVLDETTIYGQSPILSGSLSEDDLNPERNIDMALMNFNFDKETKRNIKKKARDIYLPLNGLDFSKDSAKFVIDAYKENNLSTLGLHYDKEPEQLDIPQRELLLKLGSKVLETAILSKYNLKSYENYEHYEICKQNLLNIGKAYNISDNTSHILKLENLPNLKEMYLQENLDLYDIFKIRHLSNAKYYRKWINEVGENFNAEEISREYFKEIKGNGKFFETNKGKLLKNLGLFGVSTALGTIISGSEGLIVGLSLGLLDTFWFESIFKGKNPSMFINDLRKEIEKK